MILILSTFKKPGGGPQGYIYNLENGLIGKKHDFVFWSVFIIHDRVQPVSLIEKYKKIPYFIKELFVVFSFLRLNFITLFSFDLLKKLRNSRSIIVNDQSFLFIMVVARIFRLKVYYMQHTPTPWKEEVFSNLGSRPSLIFKLLIHWIEKVHFLIATKCILPTKNSVNSYDELKGVYKEYVLSGSPNLKIINSIRDKSVLKVAFFGRFHEHKGFDIYLDLVKECSNLENIHFYCAGAGKIPVPDLKNLTNLGWIKDIDNAIHSIDVVICPNRYTYFDLLPLEVMSAGRILVLSDIGGNIDLGSMSNGIHVAKNNDIHAYKKIILDIHNDFKENKTHTYESNNIQLYSEVFTISAFADRYIKYFENN
jgi:glycosyltransferase involved in cell wall biosynthesis